MRGPSARTAAKSGLDDWRDTARRQEERYRRLARRPCDLRLNGPPDRTFHPDAAPYLWATEYPWVAPNAFQIAGRSVLCIAGSGDVPLFFLSRGAARLAAVDVAHAACHVNELKRAALKTCRWEEFLRFFLGGERRAVGFLRDLGVPSGVDRKLEALVWDRLKPLVSASARGYWEARFHPEASPFSSLLRPTDLLCPDRMPLLADREEFERWKRSARPYPLFPCSLEAFLGGGIGEFDLVYGSNVLEYVRADFAASGDEGGYEAFLVSLARLLARTVTPGGTAGFYAFQGCGTAAFRERLSEFKILEEAGFSGSLVPLEIRSRYLSGTRWRHTLLMFRRR